MAMHEAVEHARGGRQVLVLGQNGHDVRELLRAAADIASADVATITQANGREAIRFAGGGSIRFLSRRASVRGYSADVVYLPDWRMIQDDAFMLDLLPVFATRGEQPRIGVLA